MTYIFLLHIVFCLLYVYIMELVICIYIAIMLPWSLLCGDAVMDALSWSSMLAKAIMKVTSNY